MASNSQHDISNQPGRFGGILALGFAMLGAPVAWAIHFNVVYFLVQPVCRLGGEVLFHIAGVIALVVVAAAAVVAWRTGRNYGGDFSEAIEGKGDWRGFIRLYGVASAALFGYAIIYQWTPVFRMDACTGTLSL